MIEDAQARGLASERTMWESVDALEGMLCIMKREHPEEFWKFMREQHGVIWHNHYSEDFAEHDIKHMRYKDREGKEHKGGKWTKDEVVGAMNGRPFPSGTTDCDKWVAANVMYADLCRVLDDEEIIEVAYTFFFDDDDWDYARGGKVWKYNTIRS